MATWEHLAIMLALLLAMAAALISSDSEAREEVSDFLAQALRPQLADSVSDPGYLSGMAAGSFQPLPTNADLARVGADRPSPPTD